MEMRSLVSGRSGATRVALLAIAALLASALVVAPATGSTLAGATLKIVDPAKYGVVGSIPPTNYGNPSINLQSLVMAPVCPDGPEAQAASLYCIAGIEFESPVTGKMVSAVFDGYVEQPSGADEVLSMPGDPSTGLPAGRSMTLWNLPGLPGSTGKTTYLLTAGLDLEIDPTSGMWGPTSVNHNPPTKVFFQPYDYSPYDYSAGMDPCVLDEDFAKIWSDAEGCAQVVDYAQDARIQLTMVVPKYVGGWFSGRMGTPEIQLSDLSPTSNLLEITASTVSVSESPAITANQEMLDAVFGPGVYDLDPAGDGTMTRPLEFGEIPLLAPFVDDAPQKIERRWNFTQYPDVAGSCYTGAGQLQAFTTTNAMQFQSAAPEFDTTTGQFSFKLSGFHYEADKTTEATGSYDFVVRREILDCLYGFEAASAITGQADVRDGAATQTGVSVESVPGSDMVRISLQGFHFSSPETLIKFDGSVSTLKRFTATPTPVMSSGIRVDATVEASTGNWDPAATLTYQWYLNGVAIAGANAATYTPTPSQFNRLLSVKVRGSKTGYLSSTQSSSGKLVGAATTAPAYSAITPVSGPVAGGTLVTLTGVRFTGATSVKFGGVAGTSLSVASDGKLTVKAPAHAAGAVNVVVTTPNGSSSAKTFTYVAPVPVPVPAPAVTAVSPVSGSTAGGTTVTLTGAHFTGATSVKFGGVAGTSLSVASDGKLTVKAPAHAAGAVNVVVTTPSGTSSAKTFTYVAPVVSPSGFAAGTTRLSGASRYDTAIQVSKQYAPGVPAVFVATGTNFPDALSAAAAAASLGGPLLLTTPTSLPAAVKAEIQRLAPAKIYVIGGTGAVSASVASELAKIAPVTRFGGANRYDTGLQIVNGTFSSSTTAILATGRSFPDALAATGVAGTLNAPVILVDGVKSTLTSATLTTLSSLGVKNVIIAGGTGVVSKGIVTQLQGKGYNVTRYGGADRYATAALMNSHFFPKGSSDTMFLATGTNFPDALAGAALAGRLGAPLYITTPTCAPKSIHDSVVALAPTKTAVLGGTAVVSSNAAKNQTCK